MAIHFFDNFNDNSLDSSTWKGYGTALVEQNKRLEHTLEDNQAQGVASQDVFGLSGRQIELIGWSNRTVKADYLYLRLLIWQDSDHRYEVYCKNQCWRRYVKDGTNEQTSGVWDVNPPDYRPNRKFDICMRFKPNGYIDFVFDKTVCATWGPYTATRGRIYLQSAYGGRFDNVCFQDIVET